MLSKKKILITQNKFVHIIVTEDIIFCQADDGYTKIIMENGKSFILVKSLSKVAEEDLNAEHFIRVNQSYLINKNFIQLIDKQKKKVHLLNDEWISYTVNLKDLMSQIKSS